MTALPQITGTQAGAWLREAAQLIAEQGSHPRARDMAHRVIQLARLGHLFEQALEDGRIVFRPTTRARPLMLEMRNWPRPADPLSPDSHPNSPEVTP